MRLGLSERYPWSCVHWMPSRAAMDDNVSPERTVTVREGRVARGAYAAADECVAVLVDEAHRFHWGRGDCLIGVDHLQDAGWCDCHAKSPHLPVDAAALSTAMAFGLSTA